MKNLLNKNLIYLGLFFVGVILLIVFFTKIKKTDDDAHQSKFEETKKYIKGTIANVNTSQVYILEPTPEYSIKKPLILKVIDVKTDTIKMMRFSKDKFINLNPYLSVKELLKEENNVKTVSLSKQDLIKAIRNTDEVVASPKSDFLFEGAKYWISTVYNMGSPFFEVIKFRKDLDSGKDDGFVIINYGGSGKILSIKPIENEVRIITQFPKKISYFDNNGSQNAFIKVEAENFYYDKYYNFNMEVLDSLNHKLFFKISLKSNDNFIYQLDNE